MKYILDALRRAEVIPDDRERDILLSVDQERVKSYAQEGTGIVVTWP